MELSFRSRLALPPCSWRNGLSAGADPNVGWFTVAWDDVSPELVELLVKAGANFDGTDNEVGELTLFGRLEAAEVLLRHGAHIDSKDYRGLTPLQALVDPGRGYVDTYYDPLPAARFLLDRGADVNALSDEGKTALDVAIEQGKGAMAELLRRHGDRRSAVGPIGSSRQPVWWLIIQLMPNLSVQVPK